MAHLCALSSGPGFPPWHRYRPPGQVTFLLMIHGLALLQLPRSCATRVADQDISPAPVLVVALVFDSLCLHDISDIVSTIYRTVSLL